MFTRVLGFTLLTCVFGQQLKVHDRCKLSNGEAGVCRNILDCESAQIEEDSDVRPIVCRYENHLPIVCCAESDPAPPPSSTTPPSRRTTPVSRRTTPVSRRTTPVSRRTTPVSRRTTTPALPTEYRGKSWEKCKEYSKAVYRKEFSSTFTLEAEVVEVNYCAVSVQELIINGEKCKPKEFPHMAALGFGERDNIAWKCGGTLISNRFVLTAAHCLFARRSGPVRWVRLGDLNLFDKTDDARPVTIAMEKTIPHPGYKATANYDDVALLKLAEDVVFTPYVRPACLNTFRSTPQGKKATATGWGVVQWTNEQGSDDLMKADLSYDSPQRCNQTYASLTKTTKKLLRGFTDETMICAGDPLGKKDTCVGDSGGPLQVILKQPYCMYSVVGLTSFGPTDCGESNSPAVYTRVSHYVPWIEGIVWPN